MSPEFVRLTDHNREPFYVRSDSITAVHLNDCPGYDAPTSILVGLETLPCQESPQDILETLNADVIEVDAA